MKVLLAKLNVSLDDKNALEKDTPDHQALIELDTFCNGLIVQAFVKDFFNRAKSKADKEFLWLSPAHGRFNHVFLSLGAGKFPVDRLTVCLPDLGQTGDEFFASGSFSSAEMNQLEGKYPGLKRLEPQGKT